MSLDRDLHENSGTIYKIDPRRLSEMVEKLSRRVSRWLPCAIWIRSSSCGSSFGAEPKGDCEGISSVPVEHALKVCQRWVPTAQYIYFRGLHCLDAPSAYVCYTTIPDDSSHPVTPPPLPPRSHTRRFVHPVHHPRPLRSPAATPSPPTPNQTFSRYRRIARVYASGCLRTRGQCCPTGRRLPGRHLRAEGEKKVLGVDWGKIIRELTRRRLFLTCTRDTIFP